MAVRPHVRALVVLVALAGLVAFGLPAAAEHEDRPRTDNLHPMGHIEEPRTFPTDIHTDVAFWGSHAFQGSWDGGFNVRDVSAPGNPRHVSTTPCDGPQGDVVVWDHVLVRSWDGGAAPTSGAGPDAECAGEPVIENFAGLHIFDVSDRTDPELVGSVELSQRVPGPGDPEPDAVSCGSHTATGVPDLANDRLLIYNSPSTGACPWIDVVEVPLDAPEDAAFVRQVPAQRPCHDTGVILGDAMLATCAGGNGFTTFTLDPDNLDDPQFLISKDVNEEPEIFGVTIGHSAAFSWDGEILVFGHEPGGGGAPFCQEDTPDPFKSAMFFDPRTGELFGMWTLPRPQTATENCTIHNYNIVPTRSGTNVMVGGHYQAGTWVVDFTDPSDPQTLAWSDPPPVDPDTLVLGGAWSSYWYNNFVYETHINEGLNIFRFSGRETAGALRLPHLNPQTQEFTIP